MSWNGCGFAHGRKLVIIEVHFRLSCTLSQRNSGSHAELKSITRWAGDLMDARCRIELFGGLRITQGERVITRFRTQKAASLLAYLAYHFPQAHPREVLIEMLWPEVEPATGRNRLRMALTFLRHPLEPPGVP